MPVIEAWIHIQFFQNYLSLIICFFKTCRSRMVELRSTQWSHAMQVIFASRDPEGAQLRRLAVRRVRFAMRRLVWLVPRVRGATVGREWPARRHRQTMPGGADDEQLRLCSRYLNCQRLAFCAAERADTRHACANAQLAARLQPATLASSCVDSSHLNNEKTPWITPRQSCQIARPLARN